MTSPSTRALVLGLAMVLGSIVAGCLQQPTEREPSQSPNPNGGTVTQPSEQLSGTNAPPLPRLFTSNVTGCRASFSGMEIPTHLVADDLTPYVSYGSTTSHVNLFMLSCEKVAVMGQDQGRGSLVVLAPAIRRPEGTPPGEFMDALFVLEIATNNPALAAWFGRGGASSLEVTHRVEPAAGTGYERMESVAKNGSEAVYELVAFPEDDFGANTRLMRWFYGPNPATDYWDIEWTGQGTQGDGGGTVRAAPNSRLARVVGGPSFAWEVLSENQVGASLRFQRGADGNA